MQEYWNTLRICNTYWLSQANDGYAKAPQNCLMWTFLCFLLLQYYSCPYQLWFSIKVLSESDVMFVLERSTTVWTIHGFLNGFIVNWLQVARPISGDRTLPWCTLPLTNNQLNGGLNWFCFLYIIYLTKCLNRKPNTMQSVKYLTDMPPWLVWTQTSTVTSMSQLMTSVGNWTTFKFPYKFSSH
jgi:hypothetical protein